MPEVIYESVNGQVLFEPNVVEKINQWYQANHQTEAGGILIGYRRQSHLHVINCSTPLENDKRSRFRFHRKDPGHSALAKQYWEATSQEAYYLGDWHTHPEGSPTPSYIDRLGWERMIRSRLGPDLIFLIVGHESWYLQRGRQRLRLK